MSNTIEERSAATSVCQSCSAPQDGRARFCTECGAPMPGQLPDMAASIPAQREEQSEESATTALPVLLSSREARAVPTVTAAPPTGRSRIKVVTLVLAVLVFLAGVVVLGLDARATHQALDETRQSLRATEATLASTQSELATAETELATTLTDLTGTKTELASVEKALADVKKQLAGKEQDLRGVRNNLAEVKSSVTIQAGQIETLKNCLNGVSIALSDAAYGDYSAALSALQAVEVSCDKAYALF